MTSCTQPNCAGTIVDDYCDVCGSPLGAAPSVPSVKAQRIAGEKEPAEDEPDDANDYRTRVEEAQLPGGVREAALREVGKLEQTSDESPEADDIRTWLETILDLPWRTKTTDWIDIQGSREVETTLRTLIEPPVADAEADAGEVESEATDIKEADAAKPDPVAAAIENADGAAADPHHDDTGETPSVLAVANEGRYPHPVLPEQQVVGPALDEIPAQKRRFAALALAAALAALLIGALFFGASRDRSVTAVSVPTVTAPATPTVTDTGVGQSTIQLEDLAESAKPFETVRIHGTYRGGEDTFLRVQRMEGGKWVEFPLPTKTDESGQFTSYVEFGQPGRYRLRVLDANSGVTSETFVLLIKG